MGHFLPVFLQLGLSAAKETVQTAATSIEKRIFGYVFMRRIFGRQDRRCQ
jgi:hypothetical protein